MAFTILEATEIYQHLWEEACGFSPESLTYFEVGAHNFIYLFIYLIYFDFRATPAAYGSSRVRGPIITAAASLHHIHSNEGSLTH